MRLVECVPNFSEGRNQNIIEAITAAIEGTEGAHLLDVDPGKDTNRTVVTFVAEYDTVVEAAFNAIRTASRAIDMSKHSGAHARMGATDVCPFVPVSGVTMDDCVKLANDLGERVGRELGIPVYLYENAAKTEERRNLATVRSGEYEGLPEKLKDPNWKPDYGPAEFNPRTGATVIGAREFLIAYNVNLNTRDRKLANDIALSIREAGRAKRDENGKFVRDSDGSVVKVPGTLKACKAVGWYIEEYKQAQVSINLVNFHLTPPHVAFDEVVRQAGERGMRVTGSELVGLMPLEAVLQAGRHYLELQGKSTGVPEKDLIDTAVKSLGLNDISSFDPSQKIIEYRVAGATPPNLTAGKKGYEGVDEEMKTVAAQAQALKDAFLDAVDDDSRAFDGVMAAMRLPKKTDEDKQHRMEMIEKATKKAVEVPLSVLKRCGEAVSLIETVAAEGNENSISDAGVAALCLRSAASGAELNVLINLPGLSDKGYVEKARREATSVCEHVNGRCMEVFQRVFDRLGGSFE
ncbi:MAG: glutamate formimidoyltransferase [bacterium]